MWPLVWNCPVEPDRITSENKTEGNDIPSQALNISVADSSARSKRVPWALPHPFCLLTGSFLFWFSEVFYTCYELLIAPVMSFPEYDTSPSFSLFATLTFFLFSLLQCSLKLRGNHVNVWFRAKHFLTAYFQHLAQWWVLNHHYLPERCFYD